MTSDGALNFQPGDEPNTVSVPLTCGHFTTVHEASSTFDFPGDSHFCPVCKAEKQLHLTVQVALYERSQDRPI